MQIIRNVIGRTNCILDTISTEYQTSIYARLPPHVFDPSEYICITMRMRWNGMHKGEHDLKAITYPAYDTHHRLRTIRGKIQLVVLDILIPQRLYVYSCYI